MSSNTTQVVDADYSDEEKERILQYVLELRKDYIVGFLKERELARSGTKQDLRERIQEYLAGDQLNFAELVELLNTIVPYGKQHVYLYDGPEGEVDTWRDRTKATNILTQNELLQYTEASLPLALPKDLSLTRIRYEPERRLSVVAVERRDHWERLPDRDRKTVSAGVEIEFRAFAHQVTRGIIIFNWDLVGNMAQLQISQLASGNQYETIAKSFADATASWLRLSTFGIVDIGRAIAHLHELEERGHPEARYHGIGYRTPGGRSVYAQSPMARLSVFGETPVDNAMRDIRGQGSLGHIGNFYWLPRDVNPAHNNPLEKEVHTILVGNKKRVNLTTPNKESDIQYVLSRVRALSS